MQALSVRRALCTNSALLLLEHNDPTDRGTGYRVTDSHDSSLMRSCEYRQCMKMVYRVLKAGRLGGNNTVQGG